MKQVRTIEGVYRVLGGEHRVAALTKARRKQAWFWRRQRQQFPADTYIVVTRELERLGYEAPAGLWRMRGVKHVA